MGIKVIQALQADIEIETRIDVRVKGSGGVMKRLVECKMDAEEWEFAELETLHLFDEAGFELVFSHQLQEGLGDVE
jgi:hypothetical protein